MSLLPKSMLSVEHTIPISEKLINYEGHAIAQGFIVKMSLKYCIPIVTV